MEENRTENKVKADDSKDEKLSKKMKTSARPCTKLEMEEKGPIGYLTICLTHPTSVNGLIVKSLTARVAW